jgi:hypothetical protein
LRNELTYLSIYLSICLSVCLSMALHLFVGPEPLFNLMSFPSRLIYLSDIGQPERIPVLVQLEYLVATVHGKLRSGRAGPFVKVEVCCD